MADDVWLALSKGALAFAHSRAGELTGTTFRDAGALVGSLGDGSPPGTFKQRFEQLKNDIDQLQAAAVIDAVEPQVEKGVRAVQEMAAALGASPFTWEAAEQAATKLADLLQALDVAIEIVALKIAEPEPNDGARRLIVEQIHGIKEPWIAPFRSVAADPSRAFDVLCHALLGVDNASQGLASALSWDRKNFLIAAKIGGSGQKKFDGLSFDDLSIDAFFSCQNPAKLGICVNTQVTLGLRSDKLLERIIPGEAPTATSDTVAVTLDTHDGLTFGSGADKKLIVPIRFSGLDLREFSIADAGSGRIDLLVTIAGKIDDTVGIVAEGAGFTVTWKGTAAAPFDVRPKPPDAVDLKVDAAVVKGGGYLRYKANQYGGVLDLRFTEIGITAIGFLTPDPFSFVVVMGVHFLPKIELSFGFTLDGLGGLIAVERGIATDQLVKGLRDGAVEQLLFPDDPIAAAPKILDRLGAIFPRLSGGFVVGPIAEVGWGSQAGFLKARIGIVLALPDPRILVLGALQVGVPSADTPEKYRIVDLHADLLAEITPDLFLLRVSLKNSKLAGITIVGNLGMVIRWSDGGVFAFSAGGFFPKYVAPPELADLQRIALELSPPVAGLKLRASGYFAVTANSLQFGGIIKLTADLSPCSAEAWLSVDALFKWEPRFYFDFLVDAGITIKAFGESIAGVSFHGELSGMKPWYLEGHASVHILFWDVRADIGPIEWGERDERPQVTVSPRALVAEALRQDAAWTTTLPAGSQMIIRLVKDETTPLLVHPLGALEAKQLSLPLEVQIDRIGGAAVDSHRVTLANPTVSGRDAAAVSDVIDMFPPGHFIHLNDDEQMSRPDFERFACGMRVTAAAGAVHGPAIGVTGSWNTVFPGMSLPRILSGWELQGLARAVCAGSVLATAMRARVNPYLAVTSLAVTSDGAAGMLGLKDAGLMTVRRVDDMTRLAAITGTPDVLNTTQAAGLAKTLIAARVGQLQLVAAGFAQ